MWVALPEETEIVDHVVASDCPTVDRIPNLSDHGADVLVTRFASHLAEAVYAPAHAEIDAIHPGRPGATLALFQGQGGETPSCSAPCVRPPGRHDGRLPTRTAFRCATSLDSFARFPDRSGARRDWGAAAVVGAGTDSTKEPGRGGPVIVLVRPQLAVNIGMAARAMANFGLSDLRLVAPKGGWPPPDKYRLEAEAAAAGALHLLQAARVFLTIEEAVADLSAVYATTARERGQGKRVLPPDIAMAEWAAPIAAGEVRGILFGPERTGLDSDEIALADGIVTFPVNQAYGSLNLAQAVLLMGYEWMKQASDVALPFGWVERSRPASREAVLSFFTYLETELTAAGFFRPDGKQPVMRRNLRNMFHRMGLSEQDVRTLRGAVVRLVQGPRRAPAPPES